jgi:hypothetical protein
MEFDNDWLMARILASHRPVAFGRESQMEERRLDSGRSGWRLGPFDSLAECCEADVERERDAPDVRPRGVCVAALDARERGNGEAGPVRQILLRVPALGAQTAQHSRQGWVRVAGCRHN